jgi:hypothetical protein
MALLEVYRCDTKTLMLNFASSDGTPMNVSGFEVRGVAKNSYTQSNAEAIFNKAVTGIDAAAVTGLVYFPLTTGDTNQCPGDYLLDFCITDLSSGRSTYATEGLRIVPTTYAL